MGKISEGSGNNLGHQRSTRPTGFTKLATFAGILGWLLTLIYLLLAKESPGSLDYVAPGGEGELRHWLMVAVALTSLASSLILVIPGLFLALVGTLRGEWSRWLATAWLLPISIVLFWLAVRSGLVGVF